AQLQMMVQPNGNILHPLQRDKLLADAPKAFQISTELARAAVEQWIRELKIEVSSRPPPTPSGPPSKPVDNLVAEVRDSQVYLRWQLPPDQCDQIIVARSDT